MSKRIPEINKIIGLKVVAIKGYKGRSVEPVFILFSDKQTYIKLVEQDVYTYHDCANWARIIEITQDEEFWNRLYKEYPDSTIDIM